MPTPEPVTWISLSDQELRITALAAPVMDVAHTLSDAECAVITSAVDKRRQEFATGRWLARKGLASLDIPVDSILRNPEGGPLWPQSVVGSITHTSQHVAALVSADPGVAGVGVDMERMGRVQTSILRKILTEGERARLGELDPTLIFSAKESCYKVLSPIFGEYVEFQAVEIDVNPADSSFTIAYVGEKPHHGLIELARGSFQVYEDCWLTCVVLPASALAQAR